MHKGMIKQKHRKQFRKLTNLNIFYLDNWITNDQLITIHIKLFVFINFILPDVTFFINLYN